MATLIHHTAVVDPKAELADEVEVGPYAVIGPHVQIDQHTRIGPYCVIEGRTSIGKHNTIYASAQIGTPSQAFSWNRKPNTLIIGDYNVIREFCTINPSSTSDGCTRIGDYNLLMAYVHIAHDCTLSNHIVMANMASLAGFVQIEDEAVIGGMVGVHQFVRIGKMSMVGGCSKITKDVLPYSCVDGRPARCYGINSIGLRRRSLSLKTINTIKRAFLLLLKDGLNTTQAIAAIASDTTLQCPEVKHLIEFIKRSKRGVIKYRP